MAVTSNERPNRPTRLCGAMVVVGLFVALVGVVLVLTVALAVPGVILTVAGLGISAFALAGAKAVEHGPWE